MVLPEFVKKFMGVSEEDYEYEYEEDEKQAQFDSEKNINVNQNNGREVTVIKTMDQENSKIAVMPGVASNNAEVMVIEPRAFDEMPQVIDALRERKSVVLNLEMMDPQDAQRAVDFVAGGTYAMDGHYERVGESIFLFTPSCVTVSNLSGLISSADDFAAIRNRRPMGHSVNNSVDPWSENIAVAH